MNNDDFIEVARFGSRLEAESIGHALDQYDIPYIVKGDGPLAGLGSDALGAASLWVPKASAAEVAGLLSCVVRLPDNLPDE